MARTIRDPSESSESSSRALEDDDDYESLPPPAYHSDSSSSTSSSSSEEGDASTLALPARPLTCLPEMMQQSALLCDDDFHHPRPPPSSLGLSTIDEEALPESDMRLATAWWTTRRQRRRHRCWFQRGPVDVDEEKDEAGPVDLDTGTQWSVASDDEAHERLFLGDDRCSIVSAATSDRTPVVCNRSPTRKVMPLSGIDESKSWQWRELCDYRTYAGKVAISLLLIFLLALVTVVVSSTVLRESGSVKEEAPAGEEGPPLEHANGTVIERPTFAPGPRGPETAFPTWEPTSLPSSRPSLAPASPSSVEATPAPTTTPPSASPTIAFANLELQDAGVIEGWTNAAFGSSTALSANGRVLVIGARDATAGGQSRAGRVEIIEYVLGLGWTALATLEGRRTQDAFGTTVDVSDDGRIVVVGEPGYAGLDNDRSGNVRAYRYRSVDNGVNAVYELMGQELAGPAEIAYFGAALSLSGNGQRLAVASPYYSDAQRMQGQVQVYELREVDGQGSYWEPLGSPMLGSDAFDRFGSAVSLSEDGQVLAASAPQNSRLKGYVKVYRFDEAQQDWVPFGDGLIVNERGPARADDRFGHALSVSLVREGSYRVAIGVPFKDRGPQKNYGMVIAYEFRLEGGVSSSRFVGNLLYGDQNNDEFGYSVHLIQGRYLAVGAPGTNERTGAVHLYRFVPGEWVKYDKDLEGDGAGDDFGYSVSVARPGVNDLLLAGGAIGGSSNAPGYVATYRQKTDR